VNVYTPILVLGIIAAAFAIFSLAAGALAGSQRYNRTRLAAYECGIDPAPRNSSAKIPIKYFLTAMLFIIFDIEIVFLYPWAVAFDQLGLFGLYAMFLFILTISVAYVYDWRRGGLEWD